MANIIEIHDFSDPALDIYARLTENNCSIARTPTTRSSSRKVRSSSAVRLMRAVSRCRF